MKWTDKFENVCEGTVAEYKESLMIKEPDTPVVRKTIINTPPVFTRKKGYTKWTKELDDKIAELKNSGKDNDSIRKAIQNIVGHKLSEDVIPNRINILNKQGYNIKVGERYHNMGMQSAFIRSRTKSLMNKFGHNYEQARQMAFDEWRVQHNNIPGLKMQSPKTVVLFELVKIDDAGERSVVNVYTSRDDAVRMRDECIIASDAIKERAIYIIQKKK